ncbi:MAG: c-type cytochrome [Planctomycetes bacterium]|nr:c-type cytochrome [Planctomycetota bacterium]
MIRSRRAVWLALAFLVLCVTGAAFASRLWREPALTPAIRGEQVARKMGCFACHGAEGRGGIADPGARGGVVPGWDGPTVSSFAKDEQEIREWILDGAPRRVREAGAAKAPFIPMPAYRGLIGEQELSDLVAYFRAVSGGFAEIPEAAYEGRAIAGRVGCFGCHGPAGAGGCANPGSFKGHIPAWDGEEFLELVRDDAELREWILDGHPKRLWENPAAKHFLEKQTIQMPAYRPYLRDDEVAKLVAYIRWLRKKQP